MVTAFTVRDSGRHQHDSAIQSAVWMLDIDVNQVGVERIEVQPGRLGHAVVISINGIP